MERGIAMRTTISIIAFSIAATAGFSVPAAATDKPAPSQAREVKYCMAPEALTGSRMRTVQCLTKAEWAARGVDIDEQRRK
jgi:hypothetical protein